MLFASILALAVATIAAPSRGLEKRAQTIYLAGDSTMAKASGAITGWGVFFPYSTTLNVVNAAIGGRSARSFTREGRFNDIINRLQANDIVIMEFGHNDGGSLSTDNGRTDCPGAGSETCQTTYNGVPETVHTFPWYLTEAGKAIIAKGGKVILSSQTPNNPWESGSFAYTDGGRFVGYAKAVATALGSSNAMYVDHGAYTANYWKTIGKPATDALFPQDHTHTSPAGADAVAKAFVKGLQCGGGGFLTGFIKNATDTIPGTCL
ncbi:hypothetical protein ACEQ8H_007838 [Pleosporales sp. CAS-2024a]